jgi:hypothetical protein
MLDSIAVLGREDAQARQIVTRLTAATVAGAGSLVRAGRVLAWFPAIPRYAIA